MLVTRCVCQDRSFAELIDRQELTGETPDELMSATGCGHQCGMCRPYLRIALRERTSAVPLREVGPEEDPGAGSPSGSAML